MLLHDRFPELLDQFPNASLLDLYGASMHFYGDGSVVMKCGNKEKKLTVGSDNMKKISALMAHEEK